jgi:hypothetical protein
MPGPIYLNSCLSPPPVSPPLTITLLGFFLAKAGVALGILKINKRYKYKFNNIVMTSSRLIVRYNFPKGVPHSSIIRRKSVASLNECTFE